MEQECDEVRSWVVRSLEEHAKNEEVERIEKENLEQRVSAIMEKRGKNSPKSPENSQRRLNELVKKSTRNLQIKFSKFENALNIDLSGLKLSKSRLLVALNACAFPNVEILNLSAQDPFEEEYCFCDEDVEEMFLNLPPYGGFRKLQRLNLSANKIKSGLAMVLKALPHLKHLYVSDNEIGDEDLIAITMTPELEVLDLSRNQLSAQGLQHLVKTSGNLRKLNLFGNQLGLEAAHELAELLRRTSTLLVLDVRETHLTDKGKEIVKRGLQFNNTFVKLTSLDPFAQTPTETDNEFITGRRCEVIF